MCIALETQEKTARRSFTLVCTLQAPAESAETITKQLVKKAQAKLVYEFIVKHANLEYYLDDMPAQVTVETDGKSHEKVSCANPALKTTLVSHKKKKIVITFFQAMLLITPKLHRIRCGDLVEICYVTGKTQQGVKAFPRGVNIQQWHEMRRQTRKARDFLQEKAKGFLLDAKALRHDKKQL